MPKVAILLQELAITTKQILGTVLWMCPGVSVHTNALQCWICISETNFSLEIFGFTCALASHSVGAFGANKGHPFRAIEFVPLSSNALSSFTALLHRFSDSFYTIGWCARIADEKN